MTPFSVAAAPCSWGVLEFDVDGEAAGPEGVLDEMAEAGYAGTELGDYGFLPTDPEVLGRALARRRLEVMAAFVPVALADQGAHGRGLDKALTVGKLLAEVCDHPFVILADDNGTVAERTASAGRISPDQGLDPTRWNVAARCVESIAKRLRDDLGMATVFHHHCGGFVETPEEVAELMRRTSPELLGLCLDTGHYAFGGGDPLEALDRYGDRIWHVHLKDFDPEVASHGAAVGWGYFESVRAGVFCELGRGGVPFEGLLEGLGTSGYEGWLVVEQDVLPGMGSPLESAKRNRAFLKKLGV